MQSGNSVGTVPGPMTARKKYALFSVIGGIIAVFIGLYYAGAMESRPKHVPKVLRPEDFQSTLDAELLSGLDGVEGSSLSTWLDANVLKPYIDDVVTGQTQISGVEVTSDQFPAMRNLATVIPECANILHLPKAPRVFVVNEPSFSAYAANSVEPIIVIHADLIYACETVDDLRFVIAHEMGHIACGHVKWMTICRALMETVGFDKGGLRSAIAGASILPLLQWRREAEISADRAALLCVQDIKKCEQTLARLATGLPESITGEIDIDAFLAQGLDRERSDFSETYLFLKGLARTHPYPCMRIKALREYYNSEIYKQIMLD